MPLCELLVSRGADPMAENNDKRTPLDVIGLYRGLNSPDHPTLPPLTAAQKQERIDRLLFVFGEWYEVQRKEGNWQRRKHYMLFLSGSGYRPSAAWREMIKVQANAAVVVGVDAVAVAVKPDCAAPIPAVPRDWKYLLGQVFAYNERVETASAQTPSSQDRGDYVELINAFL